MFKKKQKTARMQIILIADLAKDKPSELIFSEDVPIDDPKLFMPIGTLIDIPFTKRCSQQKLYDDFRVIDRRVIFKKEGTGRKFDLYNFYVQPLDENEPAARHYINFVDCWGEEE